MPSIVRLFDVSAGHGCWNPRPNDSGSPNVFVDGRPVVRVGDHWVVHCCGGATYSISGPFITPVTTTSDDPPVEVHTSQSAGYVEFTPIPGGFTLTGVNPPAAHRYGDIFSGDPSTLTINGLQIILELENLNYLIEGSGILEVTVNNDLSSGIPTSIGDGITFTPFPGGFTLDNIPTTADLIYDVREYGLNDVEIDSVLNYNVATDVSPNWDFVPLPDGFIVRGIPTPENGQDLYAPLEGLQIAPDEGAPVYISFEQPQVQQTVAFTSILGTRYSALGLKFRVGEPLAIETTTSGSPLFPQVNYVNDLGQSGTFVNLIDANGVVTPLSLAWTGPDEVTVLGIAAFMGESLFAVPDELYVVNESGQSPVTVDSTTTLDIPVQVSSDFDFVAIPGGFIIRGIPSPEVSGDLYAPIEAIQIIPDPSLNITPINISFMDGILPPTNLNSLSDSGSYTGLIDINGVVTSVSIAWTGPDEVTVTGIDQYLGEMMLPMSMFNGLQIVPDPDLFLPISVNLSEPDIPPTEVLGLVPEPYWNNFGQGGMLANLINAIGEKTPVSIAWTGPRQITVKGISGPPISINFSPPELDPLDVEGIVPEPYWNNALGASGSKSDLVNALDKPTPVGVAWGLPAITAHVVGADGVHRPLKASWSGASQVTVTGLGMFCHDGFQAIGSPNVFANSRSVARSGDLISCTDHALQGSPDVFAN